MKNEYNIVVTDELIARYLSGEATPDEAMALQDWLVTAANRQHFEALQAAWHGAYPSAAPRPTNPERAWSSVNAAPADETLPGVGVVPFATIWRVAAALLLVGIVGLNLYDQIAGKKQPGIVVLTQNNLRMVRLPDQSLATLFRNSMIAYPQTFTRGRRQVEFSEGEAFFNVVANRDQPFIIATPAGGIQVVGTAFHVSLDSGVLRVSVAEGSVLVFTSADSLLLEAGSSATVGPGGITPQRHIDPNAWAFATHKFSFRDTPLREVIASMQKAYSCTIRTANPELANCRLTATFDHVSVENMLTLIADVLNVSVSKNNTVFVLEGEGCP